MVRNASNLKEVIHQCDEGPIKTSKPVRLKYEKEERADFKGESIAFRPAIEDIDFEEDESKKQVEQITVFVEQGEYVAWKVEYADKDFVYSHLVPWHRVLKIEYGFPYNQGDNQ